MRNMEKVAGFFGMDDAAFYLTPALQDAIPIHDLASWLTLPFCTRPNMPLMHTTLLIKTRTL